MTKEEILEGAIAFEDYAAAITAMAENVHAANKKWWTDLHTGLPIDRNPGELLALIHSEVSECLEGVRKNAMDDKLPWRKAEEVELADVLIRVFDYAKGRGLDLGGAYAEKMFYNAHRADHKHENRLKADGKKF